MGSQAVLDRLRSERSNPQADIWWGAPSDLFEQAGEEELLLPYRPTWAEAVPPEARGSGDFWYGTYKTPEVIAYNSALLKPVWHLEAEKLGLTLEGQSKNVSKILSMVTYAQFLPV